MIGISKTYEAEKLQQGASHFCGLLLEVLSQDNRCLATPADRRPHARYMMLAFLLKQASLAST